MEVEPCVSTEETLSHSKSLLFQGHLLSSQHSSQEALASVNEILRMRQNPKEPSLRLMRRTGPGQ